jgi:integrase
MKKLFVAMDPEESIRYKFFLGTACRDKEVTFAAWSDIDFTKGLYHVRPKKDADNNDPASNATSATAGLFFLSVSGPDTV